MIKRTIVCSICNASYTEKEANEGFPKWGAIHGISLNGIDNPHVCPQHLAAVAEFVDKLANAKLLNVGS